MKLKIIQLLLLMVLAGCNQGVENVPAIKAIAIETPSIDTSPNTADENIAIPNNSSKSQYAILFMGNSHVLGLNLILTELLQQGVPEKDVEQIIVNSGDYLADRLDDERSLDVLQASNWSHVILQAQKYSQSGNYEYPTDGAQAWIKYAKAQNTTPILFPEHPQRNNSREGQSVHNLHVSIAEKQSSCVAPVGLVWDRVITLRPDLNLYQADGNHAADLGKFLSALVFFEIISGLPADLLPHIESVEVDQNTQDFMGQIVTEVIAANPPCQY